MTTRCVARCLLLVCPLLAVLAAPAQSQTASLAQATPDALACAPRLAHDESTPAGLVVGAPDVPLRELFGQGDGVLLSVGRAEGVSVGTQFFTRRAEAPADPALRARGVRLLRTSGWLRAVEVDEHAALAVIERTCVAVRRGDQLAPFQWPASVSMAPKGTVSYDDSAMVLFGRDGRALSGTGQLLVIDRGADRQIVPGQRVTIFRASTRSPEDPVTRLGEAVVMLVAPTSATIQLLQMREPVMSGDRVAVHR